MPFRPFSFILILALLLLLPGGLARGQDPEPRRSETVPTMSPSEIEPGMTGYGLTVFTGTEVERFDVEIKGVLGKWFVGGDLIVAELSHPALEDIGVIAGMSGSPVFIDGKLIGAVAYGWSFQRRPLCGITPIGDMWRVLDLVTEEPQLNEDEVPAGGWPEAREALGGRGLEPIVIPPHSLREMGLEDTATGSPRGAELRPLATPLLASTGNPHVMHKLEELFAGTLFEPVMATRQGGGMGDRSGDPGLANIPMEDGSAISVLLADGDLRLAGIGTTTFVDGDRLVAYGHPFMGMGPMDAPVALAEVVTVIPSMATPFKLGNVIREVGALRQDRRPAIGATLARGARLVPMTVDLSAGDTERSQTFNFRLWENRNFLPQLALICLLESLDEVSRVDGPMSLQLRYDVRLADGRGMSRTEYLSGDGVASIMAAMQISNDIGALVANRFEPVAIDSIEASIEMTPRTQLMVLERLERQTRRLYPGETFHGQVEYTRWRREPETMTFSVDIPESLRPGRYEIHVVDGPRRTVLERQFRPSLTRVESLDDLLRRAEPVFPRNAAHVLLVNPAEDLVMKGMRLEALPASVAQTIERTVRETAQTGTATGRLLSEQRIEFDAELAGSGLIEIEVLDPATRQHAQ